MRIAVTTWRNKRYGYVEKRTILRPVGATNMRVEAFDTAHPPRMIYSGLRAHKSR
jgi:hypothetical protein